MVNKLMLILFIPLVVTSVLAEPFRTRGKVILQRSWDRIVKGIKFLPRLMQDYGTTEIILTDKRDPVAKKLYSELTGFAWLGRRRGFFLWLGLLLEQWIQIGCAVGVLDQCDGW